MKIFFLILSVALTASFFPHSAMAGTSYDCDVDAVYKIVDSASNPLIPSSSAWNWASGMIKTSYNQVHGDYNDDFELDDIDLIDYEHDEARRVGTFEEAMVSWSSFLRGGRTNGLGATRIWKGVMWNEGRIDCNLCVDWDDDDPPSDMKQEWIDQMINDHLKASSNHGRWETDFCVEISNGPFIEFDGAYDCELTVKGCSTRRNNDVEGEVDKKAASVSIKIRSE